ncbi:MAG: nucleotidyltransferase domain-containing protein [Bacteroidota bacterium]
MQIRILNSAAQMQSTISTSKIVFNISDISSSKIPEPSKTVEVKPVVVNNKQEVIEVIRQNLDNFAKFSVSQVALFGSFVREEATESSDVDLVVNLHNHDYGNFCDLLDFAESLFQNREVDVITEGSLNEVNGKSTCRELEYVNRT